MKGRAVTTARSDVPTTGKASYGPVKRSATALSRTPSL